MNSTNKTVLVQGRSYEFVIGTAVGEGSGDRLGPQQVQGRALGGGQGAEAPGSSCISTIFNSTNAFKFCDFGLTANTLKSYLPG